MSNKEDNIVKRVCAELRITQKELAEELGMKPTALSNWANGDIPQIAQKALELLLENKELKYKLNIFKEAHKIAGEL
jgi:transcriptional regulator with XRE-family HTH domain